MATMTAVENKTDKLVASAIPETPKYFMRIRLNIIFVVSPTIEDNVTILFFCLAFANLINIRFAQKKGICKIL